MHYLLFYEVSGDYLARRGEFRQAHLAKAWQASANGELVLGGALGDPVEGAALLFQGELRTTHDLLYRPRLMLVEGVLASILAALASALSILSDALACLPPGIPRSNPMEIVLKNVTSLATDICGECVPHQYTPRLIFWMDRIHATAARIK